MPATKRAPKAKPPKRVDRRKTTSTRITSETRAQLEEAAAQSGRSLAQEIEFRLEQSFRKDDEELEVWGGRAARAAWRACAAAAKALATKSNQDWLKDPETFQQVQSATAALLDMFGPKGAKIEGAHNTAGAEAALLEFVKFVKAKHGVDLLDEDGLERLKRRELSQTADNIEETI